jgi:hypothetical protein
MIKFLDIIDFYINAITNLKEQVISLCSPLEEIVIRSAGNSLAYIDNRRDAKNKYNFDFWRGRYPEELERRLLYSKSNLFPDFLFKVRKIGDSFICGSLLELKDSKGGSIASFNSTIPTKFKNMEEIDVINGKSLVSRIASLIDGVLPMGEYYTFDRYCFYLVRTHRCTKKAKLSIVDGSFFETIPKESLLYNLFLQVIRNHIAKRHLEIPEKTLEDINALLKNITDQTIIAKSRVIEGASVRPRLRIMAEVHAEGNPHSSRHYPQVQEGTFNLILQKTQEVDEVEAYILEKVPEVKRFTICHKRNGPHVVFSFTSHFSV